MADNIDEQKNELSDTDNEQYMKENKIEEIKNPTTTDEESLDMNYTQEVKKNYKEEMQISVPEKDYNTGEFNLDDNSYNEGFSFSKENTVKPLKYFKCSFSACFTSKIYLKSNFLVSINSIYYYILKYFKNDYFVKQLQQ